MAKKDKGLLNKYNVKRTDGRTAAGSKHFRCAHFVLDLTHDYHARQVMYSYGARIQKEKPQLAKDLFNLLDLLEGRPPVTEAPPEETPSPEIDIHIPEGVDQVFTKEAISRLLTDVLSESFEIQEKSVTGFECAICGSSLGRPIGLVGGFHTILCQDDANAWHLYANVRPEYKMLEISSLDRDIAINDGDRSTALTFMRQRQNMLKELYSIGEKWVKERHEYRQMKLAKMRLEIQRRGPQGHQESTEPQNDEEEIDQWKSGELDAMMAARILEPKDE